MKNILKHIFVTLAVSAALSTSVDAQVVANKTATNNYDGTYTLTMEAYATGSESLTETYNKTPVDAVLVLDCSGSMDYTMSSTSYVKSTKTLSSLVSASGNDKNTYYIYWSDGNYYRISLSSYGMTGKQASFTVGTTRYNIRYNNGTYSVRTGYTEVPDAYKSVALYTSSTTTITRMKALQDACKIFVDNLKADQEKWNADHSDNPVEHRVSIVTFASSASTAVTLANGSVVSNYTTLISTINGMSANGATRADYGMTYANEQIALARTGASKLVLFFTDGTPTSRNSFETDVASSAIKNSNTIKNAGASVFALTVINFTANSNEDKFMNYISSNYPDATSMSSTGTKASDGFYSIATDQTQLSQAFATISSSVISGGTTASIDASTVVQDVVAEAFMLPAGAESSSVKVYTDDFKELQSGVYVFENNLTDAGLVPTISGKKVTVNGFDYKENYCGYRIARDASGNIMRGTNGEALMVAGGKRLVVVITIVPDPNASSTGVASTNDDSQSGLYMSDGTVVQNFVTTPSAVYTNADMTLNVTGLAEDESAVFNITANVPLNMYGTAETFNRTIAVTGPSASVVIKAPVTYLDSEGTTQFVKYTITPATWAWTYTINPDSAKESADNISGTSITKSLMKIGADETRVADNVFEFVATKKSDTVVNGESSKVNNFQWHNDSGSGGSDSASF